MNLQEIIMYNEIYAKEVKVVEDKLKSMTDAVRNINNNINLDEIKQLPYNEVKSVHKLLYWNLNDSQRKELDNILKLSKQSEYPQLTKAHYYPVINEMDFLSDTQKVELDKLMKRLYQGYIYTESSAWDKLNFNNEITDKVMNFLHNNGIIEKSYVIKCDCGSRGDCDSRYISQEQYDLYVKCMDMGYDISGLPEKEQEEFYRYCSIEAYCEYDNGGEIDDADEFKKKVKLFAYKNITKPDTSLEEV